MGVDEDAKAEDGTYGREQLTSRDQVQAAAGCIYVYIYIYICVCVCVNSAPPRCRADLHFTALHMSSLSTGHK